MEYHRGPCADHFNGLGRRDDNEMVKSRLRMTSVVQSGSGKAGSQQIPMLDLARQYERIRPEILAAIERVCASQHYILGEEVSALERELAKFTGATDVVGCASGTDALWLALVAAGVGPGDAVITTPFSFFASASAIVRAGATPVFVDIDPRTFNLNPAQLEKALQDRGLRKLRAVLPVHLYGQCADMDAITRLAAGAEISVIEDAAQAIGAAWNGRPAGSLGVAAAFSFYPTKNLSAYGDAGCVTTMDADFAEHMRRLRNHGSPRRYVHEEFGWNSRLDSIQAAILSVKMRYISEWNSQRRERAAGYDRLLMAAGLATSADNESACDRSAFDGSAEPITKGKRDLPIILPYRDPRARHVFHQYVVRAQRRDELRPFLTEHGIGSEIYYPIPLHTQSCFAYLGYREGDLPESERAAREVLALPIFPELREDEQQQVVTRIAEFYS